MAMKPFTFFLFAPVALLLAGCAHHPAAHPAAVAAVAPAVVTPDTSLSGKVVSWNETGRFVVLNFPSGIMPKLNQTLFLYRSGLKVGEVNVTGPQSEDNTVADLVGGTAQVGDEVRDQ